MEGTIESLGIDPNTVDTSTLNQLVDQHQAEAWDAANNWIGTVDLATLPIPDTPKFECKSKFGCPYAVDCNEPTWSARCIVTDCDSAKCRPCPDIFNLSNLVIKSWCAHVCIDGDKIVGIAAVVISHFQDHQLGPYCVKQ